MQHPDPYAQPDTLGRLVYRGAGLTVRAYTADELRRRLQPAEVVPTPPAALPEVAPGVPDSSGGRPGGSALAEYRRRRAVELARWTRGLPWRLGLAAATGLAGATLAAHLELPHVWLPGLLASALTAWALRFGSSQATRAWRDGARGERATGRRLRRLERDGYTVLHDLAVPGSRANIDHLAIGPAGVFVIDSKRYRGHLYQTPDGMLWHGHYPLAQALATLWWEARLVGDTLRAGPQVPITPLLVIHRATIPWGGLIVAGVPVIPPAALTEALGREPVLPGEEVAWLADRAIARLRPAA